MKTSDNNTLVIPKFSLVLLMGIQGAGKSTFAQKWFHNYSVVSSDKCRLMVANNEHAEWASSEAFELLETWVSARLKLGFLTVVDATSLEPRFRLRMLEIAREFHAPATLIIFDTTLRTCQERDLQRDKKLGGELIFRQYQRLQKALLRVMDESWNKIVRYSSQDIENIKVEIRPLRIENPTPPPYDLIGDIHGCYQELIALLEKLGYIPSDECGYIHPEGRKVIFVGDMIDRGPDSLKVIKLAYRMHTNNKALVTPGNHDDKLLRYLLGTKVRLDHGFECTVAELNKLPEKEKKEFQINMIPWIKSLPPYLMLDHGRLVVAHAGLPENFHGRLSRIVASRALFGDEPQIREPSSKIPTQKLDWASVYRGKALVIYGHTPYAEPQMKGNTLCIDQGCVFGGKLTSYRYPEGEVVQVQAKAHYYPDDAPDLFCEDPNSIQEANELDTNELLTREQEEDADQNGPLNKDVINSLNLENKTFDAKNTPEKAIGELPKSLDLPDIWSFTNGKTFETSGMGEIFIKGQVFHNAIEHLNKYGLDPRWLVYIPPQHHSTLPSELNNYLEHPKDAQTWLEHTPSPIIMEEAPGGHHCIIVIGNTADICFSRFGIKEIGMIYTATGKPFFAQQPWKEFLLKRLHQAFTQLDVFKRLNTSLLIFEADILPWSIRKQDYIFQQLLPAALSLKYSREYALEAMQKAISRNLPLKNMITTIKQDIDNANNLISWIELNKSTPTMQDLKISPLQLIASDSSNLMRLKRSFHLKEFENWWNDESLFSSFKYKNIDYKSPVISDISEITNFWEENNKKGNYGIILRREVEVSKSTPLQYPPSVMIRCKWALQAEYGPQYANIDILQRLKTRLSILKHPQTVKDWQIALSGIDSFVEGSPLKSYYPYVLVQLANRIEHGEK